MSSGQKSSRSHEIKTLHMVNRASSSIFFFVFLKKRFLPLESHSIVFSAFEFPNNGLDFDKAQWRIIVNSFFFS